MNRRWIVLLIGMALLAAGSQASVTDWGRRPLAFESNRGQAGAAVKFLARAPGYSLFLTPTEAVMAGGGEALRLRWEGARPAPRISGEKETPGRANYLIGNDPAKWRRGIPSFEKVRYQDLYPGIDLVFYGNPRRLEYDFVLAPGADPDAIRLAVQGPERTEIDGDGDLVLHFSGHEVRLKRPVSYQEVGGVRRPVASGWRRTDDGRLGFAVGKRDPSRPLVIDPVLVYSTYLGGSGFDLVQSVAADAAGNVYLTGLTGSLDFPVTPGALQPELNTSAGLFGDTFVTKLDPAGRLVYSTYLGGSNNESGFGIAVDGAGHAYVVGFSASSDFPLVHPLPHTPTGVANGFVAKLDTEGSSLVYSTYIGGPTFAGASAIDVDPAGNAYVTGVAVSSAFPTAGPIPSSYQGNGDAYLVKLSPSGERLLSRFLGGSGFESATSIAVAAGRIVVAGYTDSTVFPTLNAAQAAIGGGYEDFVIGMDATGAVVYSTFLGGRQDEGVPDVALDAAGNAWVVGGTSSTDFPVKNALQPALRPPADAFVTKLSRTGALVSSTYLGGSFGDGAFAVAVDPAGNVTVAGATASTDFPLKDPIQAECQPQDGTVCVSADAFVTRLNPAGSAILYSTYLGGSLAENGDPGSANDLAIGVAVDPRGNAYIGGMTTSMDFPTVNALQPSALGQPDGFVAKIAGRQRGRLHR
ncbi:MAG: SBBP repeat-containing protein [Thermoanaerobaculia bacterium]